jgi:hypothetical protein
MFNQLLTELKKQIDNSQYIGKVEILHDGEQKITTGEKRNNLLAKASGLFSVFIDDDDVVSHDYVEKIASCIEANPDIDCIGIKGQIITNGTDIKDWEISRDFDRWFEANGKYYRTPNHISPIRTEHCKAALFPHITIGEDSAFSAKVLPLLKTEVKIDGNIYFYRYVNANKQLNQHEFPYRPAWR